MTTFTRQIVGYDPATERVACEYVIPEDKWTLVSMLVRPDHDDPDFACSYPLDPAIAKDIMALMGERGAQGLKYFLESDAG